MKTEIITVDHDEMAVKGTREMAVMIGCARSPLPHLMERFMNRHS